MAREKLIEDMYGICFRIEDLDKGIPGFSRYTGDGAVGHGTFYNTVHASRQLEFSMALSQHTLVQKLIENDNINPSNFDAEPLVRAQILNRIKILDLGCGPIPSFARCTRAMGATVYTADVMPARHLTGRLEYEFGKNERDIEQKNHIEIDLNEPGAAEIISQRAGGDFDLVTAAHLIIGNLKWQARGLGHKKAWKIALPLLKEGGIYFDMDEGQMSRKKGVEEELAVW